MLGHADDVVYLDHAATTPVRPEAVDAMLPWLTSMAANASGAHAAARAARAAVEDARDRLAALLGCQPAELVFTSGGTEADNLAVAGRRGRLVCSALEHHAVLEPVTHAGGTALPVLPDGTVDVAAVPGDATFVSVMLVNNEIGTIQPLDEVRAAAPDAVLHTDAVQALAWLPLGLAASCADLVSVTAHKVGGPQGVGALVVREGTPLTPMLAGGGQEQDRRAGTLNVAGIVGFAAAADACAKVQAETNLHLRALRDRLVDGLLAAVPDCRETGDRARKVPGIASLLIDGVRGDELVLLLDRAGICASAAAACASGATEPSHVLTAMGVPRDRARGSLRLSLGWTSTDADVDAALAAVPAAVSQLRR
jgi:cysteine desulfurase